MWMMISQQKLEFCVWKLDLMDGMDKMDEGFLFPAGLLADFVQALGEPSLLGEGFGQ